MDTLFKLSDLQKLQRKIITLKCKTCEFCERWQCGGSFFFYCKTRKSKLTHNGLMKIKANQEACPLHPKFKNSSQ